MTDFFVMQHNYRFLYLVTIDNEQSRINKQVSRTDQVASFYKYAKCKFEEVFLVLKPGKNCQYLLENRICRNIEISGACDSSDFDGDTFLVGSDDIVFNEYAYFAGFEIINFSIEEKNLDYHNSYWHVTI